MSTNFHWEAALVYNVVEKHFREHVRSSPDSLGIMTLLPPPAAVKNSLERLDSIPNITKPFNKHIIRVPELGVPQ